MLLIQNTYFENNIKNSGGAIALSIATQKDNIPILTLINCTFLNNSAITGGAIYLINLYKLQLFILNSNFFLNIGETSKKN